MTAKTEDQPWRVHKHADDSLNHPRIQKLVDRTRHQIVLEKIEGYCRDKPYCYVSRETLSQRGNITDGRQHAIEKDLEQDGIIFRTVSKRNSSERVGIILRTRFDMRLPTADTPKKIAEAIARLVKEREETQGEKFEVDIPAEVKRFEQMEQLRIAKEQQTENERANQERALKTGPTPDRHANRDRALKTGPTTEPDNQDRALFSGPDPLIETGPDRALYIGPDPLIETGPGRALLKGPDRALFIGPQQRRSRNQDELNQEFARDSRRRLEENAPPQPGRTTSTGGDPPRPTTRPEDPAKAPSPAPALYGPMRLIEPPAPPPATGPNALDPAAWLDQLETKRRATFETFTPGKRAQILAQVAAGMIRAAEADLDKDAPKAPPPLNTIEQLFDALHGRPEVAPLLTKAIIDELGDKKSSYGPTAKLCFDAARDPALLEAIRVPFFKIREQMANKKPFKKSPAAYWRGSVENYQREHQHDQPIRASG